MNFLRKLSERFKEQAAARKLDGGTLCGKQGADGEPPECNPRLCKTNTAILASHSGPDTGVAVYKQFAPDLPATWDNPVDWAYGISVSMYDLGPTGRRNGEPVADCFGILAYQEGAILAVADGVNWGEPPRRAARCAVLGCLNHMHQALRQHETDSALDCHMVFKHLVDSIPASQKLILQQFGTLTTLVVSVVLPLKWVRTPGRWAAITMTVGDSAAYVYRAASKTVEEVTAAAHAEGARDPRWCPGALGYAMGEEPDLANMMLCLTFLDEGDYIFLTSDGVADNFDPVIRKMARHQVMDTGDADLPALSPAECQAKAMDLLRDVLVDADRRLACSAHGSDSGAASPRSPSGLGGGGGSRMTARGLAEQLLQHVYDVTEEQRQHVEARNRERERSLSREPGAGSGPSLSTDHKHGGLMGMAPVARPPGKMDHATVAAYQVGRRTPASVAKSRARSAAAEASAPTLPFMAVQAAHANSTASARSIVRQGTSGGSASATPSGAASGPSASGPSAGASGASASPSPSPHSNNNNNGSTTTTNSNASGSLAAGGGSGTVSVVGEGAPAAAAAAAGHVGEKG
ncbi:hypothetical protein HXX76_005088 [Chlamydomonas incerta]|uniref:PPM-type phosphatase domain-containing protein n=1 Tax=Chlamydomonas incerta TaxID=51695 RepID=A0A835W2V2_CHLIN|nr:hypothetical protein HXX76_005088 [Chlamydomonas incerta]|eukprot:KAG2438537.1 hypothetical protein HXX76_005088 [Chlamydomonas incerta]